MDLSWNDLSNDGAIAISQSLRKNSTLQNLDMKANDITSRGIISILETIQIKSTVIEVNFIHNMTPKSKLIMIAYIYSILKYKPTVYISFGVLMYDTDRDESYIKVSIMCLENEAASNLFKLKVYSKKASFCISHKSGDYKVEIINCNFKGNFSITHLDLSHLGISCKGVKRLLNALQVNVSLKTLFLSHNNISDDGAIAISEYLKGNSVLISLNMSYNKVTSVGTKVVGEAIQANSTLWLLDISHNAITVVGIKAFIECLKNNSSLQKLSISWLHFCLICWYFQIHHVFLDATVPLPCKHYSDIEVILISAFLHKTPHY